MKNTFLAFLKKEALIVKEFPRYYLYNDRLLYDGYGNFISVINNDVYHIIYNHRLYKRNLVRIRYSKYLYTEYYTIKGHYEN